MNKTIIAIILCTVFISFSEVYALEGKNAGTIRSVKAATGEIVIAISDGRTINMGEKLYFRKAGKPVLMTAVFPMMASARCRLLPGYNAYLQDVKNGLTVFTYVDGIEKETDSKVINNSGSINELAMLCGKSFDSVQVKNYMKALGENPEIYNSTDSIYYSYKDKGVSVMFERRDGGLFLRAVFLYNTGADKFSRYLLALPEKLSFDDTRAVVEEKLGLPDSSGGNGSINYWVNYSNFGLGITYDSKAQFDKTILMHHISISKPSLVKKK